MRFTARSLALTSVSALVLVGLTIPAADAGPSSATTFAIGALTPAVYSAASKSSSTPVTVSGTTDSSAVLLGGQTCVTSSIAVKLAGATGTPLTSTASVDPSTCGWTTTFASTDVSTLPDGTLTATASQTTGGLLPATTTKSKTLAKDTYVPPAPTIVALGSNFVINSSVAKGLTVTGSADAGSTVTLTLGSITQTAALQSTSTNWSMYFDASSLSDGNYTASVTETEPGPAHNVGPAATKGVVKDTVAAAKTSAFPADGSTVASPGKVSIAFNAAISSDSTLSLTTSGGTTVACPATVSGNTISCVPGTALGTGTYTATASVSDANGNPSTGTTTFTVDATPPSITNLAATKTTATVSKSTVSGTLSEPANLTVTATDSNGTTASGTLRVTSAGNFSLALDENALASGTITVSVRAVDPYGNVSVTTTTHARVLPPATVVTLTVPTWTAVGWAMTLNGAVHLLHPNAYGTVTLIHTSLGGKLQIVAPVVRVASNGTFKFRYFPTTSGKYYAVYNGDAKNSGVRSPIFSSQIRYAISAASPTGPASSTAVISGAVHNPAIGTVVTILKQNVDGSWTKLGTAKVDSTRHYRFAVRLPKGQSTIQVTVPSSRGYYGNAATIKVLRT